jgi:hypothetical protein
MKLLKVKTVDIDCSECQAKAGDWCQDIFGEVRAGYTLMHTSRVHEIKAEEEQK